MHNRGHMLIPVFKHIFPDNDKKSTESEHKHLETFTAIGHCHKIWVHSSYFIKNINY